MLLWSRLNGVSRTLSGYCYAQVDAHYASGSTTALQTSSPSTQRGYCVATIAHHYHAHGPLDRVQHQARTRVREPQHPSLTLPAAGAINLLCQAIVPLSDATRFLHSRLQCLVA